MSTCFLLLCLCQLTTAVYVIQDSYEPANFLDKFNFFNAPDPTRGYVNYVDQNTARSAGLVNQRDNSIYLGVDSQTANPPAGRMSVRLESKATYDQGLIILDLAHMPSSACGSWPAFWTVGDSWPTNGEIDIIEGVNSQKSNSMALHTNPGCSINDVGNAPPGIPNGPGGMPGRPGGPQGGPPNGPPFGDLPGNIDPARRRFSGSLKTPNCDVHAPGQGTNVGCAIASADDTTYGDGFNAAGGGVYATEWTAEAISIYHFSRANIPADINAGTPDPTTWGVPLAVFTGCDFTRHVNNQTIVFDVTFCGDWAGNVWNTDATCAPKAATCQDYVANNPGAFANSFWEINSLRVYQQRAGGPSPGIPNPQPSQSAPPGIPSAPSQTGIPMPSASTLSTIPLPVGSQAPPRPTSTMIVTLDLTTTVTQALSTAVPADDADDGCYDGVPGGCISRGPGRKPARTLSLPGPRAEGCIGRFGGGCVDRPRRRV